MLIKWQILYLCCNHQFRASLYLPNYVTVKRAPGEKEYNREVLQMKMVIEDMFHKGNPTSWTVAGLGLVVTGVGRMVGGNLGAGIMGFGLAHVV